MTVAPTGPTKKASGLGSNILQTPTPKAATGSINVTPPQNYLPNAMQFAQNGFTKYYDGTLDVSELP